MRVARELIHAGGMRWVWTGLLASVVGYWLWGWAFDHVSYRRVIEHGVTIRASSGSVDWILVTLIGGLITSWHVHGVIEARARRMPFVSSSLVVICAVIVVLRHLAFYARTLVAFGWGFTGWAAIDLGVNVLFLVAALKSCEIALADRRAARA